MPPTFTISHMGESMRVIKGLLRIIDSVNEWAGKVTSVVIFPLVLLVTLDVILRYVFNRPTVWAWDVNIQLAGILIVMGGGFALLHGGHIAVDVLVTRLTPRGRAVIDLVTFPIFLCAIGALLWKAIPAARESLVIKEAYTSFFAPPLYPFKIVVAVGLILLILQGIAKFIRDLQVAVHPGTRSQT